VEGKPYVGAMPPISAVAEGTYVRTDSVVLCCVVLRCVLFYSIFSYRTNSTNQYLQSQFKMTSSRSLISDLEMYSNI
jgi:hypothetical protein